MVVNDCPCPLLVSKFVYRFNHKYHGKKIRFEIISLVQIAENVCDILTLSIPRSIAMKFHTT